MEELNTYLKKITTIKDKRLTVIVGKSKKKQNESLKEVYELIDHNLNDRKTKCAKEMVKRENEMVSNGVGNR